MQEAPYFDKIADGPEGARAHWLTTADGVRVRAAHWPLEGAKGTVLIFPGRTEYIEKYGITAKALQGSGYASLAIDWRGQGIADRLLDNRAIGHVGEFADYQNDVAAMMAYATELDLPSPFFLIGHSMGGCIGLRALMNGLDVKAAMFSAPMWGVQIALPLRPVAWGLSSLGVALGFDHRIATGQSEEGYVLREDFAVNGLTNDPDIWAKLARDLRAHPDLSLGGPSLRWLNKSLREMRALSTLPAPDTPCLTYLGTEETTVDPARIRARMAAWPNGTLRVIEGGKHEMLMDKPAMRDPIQSETAAFFTSHAG